MRPPPPWSFASLRTLKALRGRPRVAATPAVTKATGSATHREPADGRRLGGDQREHGVGHEQHGLGPAHRLLGVDEPAALAARLEREVARLDRVRQEVGPQLGEGAAHVKRTPGPSSTTSPMTRAACPAPSSAASAAPTAAGVQHQRHPDAAVEDPVHLLLGHRAQAGDLGEHPRLVPRRAVQHRAQPAGQGTGQVPHDAATGDVGAGVQRLAEGGAHGEHRRGVDHRGAQELVGHGVRRPVPGGVLEVEAGPLEQHVAGQRVAVGAQPRRDQADHRVARAHPLGPELGPVLHRADREAGQVQLVGRHDARRARPSRPRSARSPPAGSPRARRPPRWRCARDRPCPSRCSRA